MEASPGENFIAEFVLVYFEENLLSVRVFIDYSKMLRFNPEVFLSKPDDDTLYYLKKDELIY